MEGYLNLLRHVLENGTKRSDRTGVGTLAVFGTQTRYDLQQGFPAVTTKRLIFSSVVKELLWFCRGSTNTSDLDCGIWDEWADENGDLGPIYGQQWRSWPTTDGGGIDQIRDVISGLQNDPHSRRHIVSSWNVGQLHEMHLPPCHLLFQFYVEDNKLSCQLYQRSADLFLGVPFNIASYALLTYLLARLVKLDVGEFIHTTGDTHIYCNHVEQVQTQLERKPKPLPRLDINKDIQSLEDILQLKPEDIRLQGYEPHPQIKAPIAV